MPAMRPRRSTATASCAASPSGRAACTRCSTPPRSARREHDALVCEGRRWSYAQTDASGERLAAGLAALGVARRRPRRAVLDNRPEFVFVLLAAAAARRDRGAGGRARAAAGPRLHRATNAARSASCSMTRWPSGCPRRARRRRCSCAWRSAARRLRRCDALPATRPRPPPAAPAETDVAVILYTSGTTGNPKGAMLTHLSIVHSVLHFEACMRLARRRRSALAVPASHVTGLIADHRDDVARRRHGRRRARVQGRRLHRAARARARHAHADGAGDVQPVPAAARASRRPTWRRGASAATAARRCRWRRSTRSPQRLPGLTLLNCLRRDRDHLADDDDARRPDARPRRLGRRRRCRRPRSA